MAILDLGRQLPTAVVAAYDAQQNRYTAGCNSFHIAVSQQQQDLYKLVAELLGSLISCETSLISSEWYSQLLVHMLVRADASTAQAIIDGLEALPASVFCFQCLTCWTVSSSLLDC